MVRVIAPMHGLTASGSIAATLTFARRGRSTTAYALTRPSQPHTAHQQSRRAMFSFIGSQWPFLTPADQLTWSPNFSGGPPTAFLQFMSTNLARWTRHAGPSQASPPTEATSPNTMDLFTATGETGRVKLQFRQHSPPDAWGWITWRSLTLPFTPNPANCAAIWPCIGAGVLIRYDAPLAPGTYHYYLGNFSIDGKLTIWTGPRTATVL